MMGAPYGLLLGLIIWFSRSSLSCSFTNGLSVAGVQYGGKCMGPPFAVMMCLTIEAPVKSAVEFV
jgi:hypothetical protein